MENDEKLVRGVLGDHASELTASGIDELVGYWRYGGSAGAIADVLQAKINGRNKLAIEYRALLSDRDEELSPVLFQAFLCALFGRRRLRKRNSAFLASTAPATSVDPAREHFELWLDHEIDLSRRQFDQDMKALDARWRREAFSNLVGASNELCG